MKKLKYILFFFFFLSGTVIIAQPGTEEQLAIQFFQNREYEKALDYYEKLFGRNPQQYFSSYISCLIETKDFRKAEKIAKKMQKQYPDELSYGVDLGRVYLASGETEKSRAAWETSIKNMRYDDQVFGLAASFMSLREYEFAIATYQRGRKISSNGYPYNAELAEVYRAKGDKPAMINEYLDMLALSDAYIQTVQNGLQSSFGADADPQQNELTKGELMKRIGRNPDKTIYSELLIWMQLQLHDWEGAFVQAKALDKRKKEEGNRMMGLAQLFAQNEAYDAAVKAYQYVIAKGPEVYYYTSARMELLNVMYTKVVNKGNYTSAELSELENNFNLAITELGKSAGTVTLMKNLAQLQAFYLNKTSAAIALLEEAIALPQLQPHVQAECKLQLADVLLVTGDIWEASLRYSQVEKAFKNDAIGQEAKFRNAKISYYTGDFKWAQAQLDVLKGATSKLIANDAMNLSLLISDATAVDSNEAPLQIFARADLLAFQNKEKEAVTAFDSINTLFPNHALADEILFRKAGMAARHGDNTVAATFYEQIMKEFSDGILADDAVFNLAEINEKRMNNPARARELYQQLIEQYPGSLYVVEARKRFRRLRGDTVN